jgi:hypothetical protein
MHTNGYFTVKDNKIVSTLNENKIFDETVGLVLDKSVGTLLHIGNKESATDYFNTVVHAYRSRGLNDIAEDITLVTFFIRPENSSFEDKFTADEICTFVNWLNNCIGNEKVNEFLSYNYHQLTELAKTLVNFDF